MPLHDSKGTLFYIGILFISKHFQGFTYHSLTEIRLCTVCAWCIGLISAVIKCGFCRYITAQWAFLRIDITSVLSVKIESNTQRAQTCPSFSKTTAFAYKSLITPVFFLTSKYPGISIPISGVIFSLLIPHFNKFPHSFSTWFCCFYIIIAHLKM